MGNKTSKQFDKESKRIGIKSNVPYAVYRPNYTAYDQTGVLIQPLMSIRYDTQAARFAEPNIPGVLYYDLFLDRRIVQSGDVLCPLVSADSNNPIITVSHYNPMKACVGFLTDQFGFITEDLDTVRYTNVRWSWAGPSFPGTGLNDALSESIKLPRRKAILYKRLGIGEPYVIRPEMRLVEFTTVNSLPNIWLISDVIQFHTVTVLTVTMDQ